MKMSKSVFKETTSAEEEAQTAAQQQRIYIHCGKKNKKERLLCGNADVAEIERMGGI